MGVLIGLSGYAGAGKDTAAQVLVERFGFRRVGFAYALKRVALAVGCWNGAKDEVGRRQLQVLGQVVREELGSEVWVRAVVEAVRPGERVVVADVRYRNEAEALRRAGGQVWRVSRAGVGPVNAHVSETDLDRWEFDVHLANVGPVETFQASVEAAVRRSRARRWEW